MQRLVRSSFHHVFGVDRCVHSFCEGQNDACNLRKVGSHLYIQVDERCHVSDDPVRKTYKRVNTCKSDPCKMPFFRYFVSNEYQGIAGKRNLYK